MTGNKSNIMLMMIFRMGQAWIKERRMNKMIIEIRLMYALASTQSHFNLDSLKGFFSGGV